MDDYFIVWALVKDPNYREECQEFDDLTSAEKYYNSIKKIDTVIIARIKWGETIIKEFRR